MTMTSSLVSTVRDFAVWIADFVRLNSAHDFFLTFEVWILVAFKPEMLITSR